MVDVGRVCSGSRGWDWVGLGRQGGGWVGLGLGCWSVGGGLVFAFSEFKRDSRDSRIYARIKKVKVSTVEP